MSILGRKFTALDWMIHFGVTMNVIVSLALAWYAFHH
ncbi:hypothetical protein MNBD_NITROSPINAE01-1203 [hydrothermal vent metagenome]|uniref:Uncharacterized protein n=1 Tax=hydrothermal vent metagenome TaxID=652676 RepID=A0A3B1D374_9ZZZZ